MADTTRDRDPNEEPTEDATPVEARADRATTVDPNANAGPETPDAESAETVPADAEPLVAAEPVTPASAPTPPEPRASGGTGSMVIGGVLAAAIGAGAVLALLPEGWRQGDAGLDARLSALEARPEALDTAALDAALSPLRNRIAALEGVNPADRLAALEARTIPDLAPVETRLSTLEGRGSGLDAAAVEAAVAPLATRIAQIEADITAQARAAVDAALAETRAEIDAQARALANREDSVEAAQARLAARTAMADLTAAAESGAPAPDALTAIAAITPVPPALTVMGDGLVTLTALQDSFAPAARAALAAEPPAEDAHIGDRVLNFLRNQTGARSLAPRDGTDTDAVLSRAEAALRGGDLAGTMQELDALTGAPAEAMTTWRAEAQVRLDALAALDTLGAQLNQRGD
jgi:hypothetical protein